MSATLLTGDALTVLRTLPDGAARCCVTSPPYFGLRDYGVEGQLGLEPTPDAYVARMVEVFREVRRVLAGDGTLWLNLGDSFAANRSYQVTDSKHVDVGNNGASRVPPGLKPKDLIGIPWRVAFALQADGWYLRSDIIWHKPNPMPESVRDRPTKSHEYVFLLSKSERYYYDADAVAEEAITPGSTHVHVGGAGTKAESVASDKRYSTRPQKTWVTKDTRNARSVWTVATKPYKGAHFATMPPALAEKCVLAGSAPGDTVLDPFGGSGTTAMVATTAARNAIHIDLNPTYHHLAVARLGLVAESASA